MCPRTTIRWTLDSVSIAALGTLHLGLPRIAYWAKALPVYLRSQFAWRSCLNSSDRIVTCCCIHHNPLRWSSMMAARAISVPRCMAFILWSSGSLYQQVRLCHSPSWCGTGRGSMMRPLVMSPIAAVGTSRRILPPWLWRAGIGSSSLMVSGVNLVLRNCRICKPVTYYPLASIYWLCRILLVCLSMSSPGIEALMTLYSHELPKLLN